MEKIRRYRKRNKMGVDEFQIGEIQFEDDTITARKKFNRFMQCP